VEKLSALINSRRYVSKHRFFDTAINCEMKHSMHRLFCKDAQREVDENH